MGSRCVPAGKGCGIPKTEPGRYGLVEVQTVGPDMIGSRHFTKDLLIKRISAHARCVGEKHSPLKDEFSIFVESREGRLLR